jgi:hypothetical protein
MTDVEMPAFERRQAERLRAFAAIPVEPVDGVAVAVAIVTSSRPRWRGRVRSAGRLALVGMLVIAGITAVALIGAALRPRPPIPYLNVFEPTGTLVRPRTGPTVAALPDGRVIVAGGRVQAGIEPQGGYIPTSTAELYDPATRQFSEAGNMSRPIDGTAVPLATGDVLIADSPGWYGFIPDDGTDRLATGLDGVLFHPATGLFTDLPSSPSPTAFHDMVALADGRVLLLGWGRGTAAWIGDPATGEARRTARIDPPVEADGDAAWTGIRLADGRVLVAIGSVGPTFVFDPVAGRFTRIPGAAGTAVGDPAHRAVVRMTLLADGRVFLTRWVDDPASRTVDAAIFDPAANETRAIAALNAPQPRVQILLRDGRVLLLREADGGSPATAMFYDPARDAFEAGPVLDPTMVGFGAAGLPNGDVLILGGATSIDDPKPAWTGLVFR